MLILMKKCFKQLSPDPPVPAYMYIYQEIINKIQMLSQALIIIGVGSNKRYLVMANVTSVLPLYN